RPMKLIALILVLAMAVKPAPPQKVQAAQKPAFEVASVKPSIRGTASDFQVLPGGRFVATNRTVTDLIFRAYRLRPYQIPDTPPSIPDRYDIEARADGNPSYNEMMLIVQSLLQDRFNLKVHWGTTEKPIFLITAARGGIKLKPSSAACVHFDQTAAV